MEDGLDPSGSERDREVNRVLIRGDIHWQKVFLGHTREAEAKEDGKPSELTSKCWAWANGQEVLPSEQSPGLPFFAPQGPKHSGVKLERCHLLSTTYCLLTCSIDHFLHFCIFETITQDSKPMLYFPHLSSSIHDAFYTSITTSIPFHLQLLILILVC